MTRPKCHLKNFNLTKICRVCLSERGRLRDIFTTKIPMMIESCASIKVSVEDGLPSQICITCFRLIAKCYTFKKKIERNDRILKNHVKINRQNERIEKDILDIAMNEAQIRTEQSNNEYTRDDGANIVNKNNVEGKIFKELIDPEQMKMQRKSIRLTRKSKEKAAKVIDEILHEETNSTQGMILAERHFEDDLFTLEETIVVEDNLRDSVFSIGPPPLVPLKPKEMANNTEKNSVPSISEEPPPLIPIKPLVDDSVLSSIIESTPNITLQCNTCEEKFCSLVTLKEHKLTICQQNSLQCNICKKEFKERKKLIGHLKGHMITKDYACKICGKRYPNPSTFRIHMRTHTGERPFKCNICNKGFTRWAGVVGHLTTHQEHKPYTCDTCGKGFKISSNLERHKVLHSANLPFCCNYCGKTFSQADNLQLHIRTYHTYERPYLCSECGKGFVSSTRLNRHMWVHSGFKPYKCSTCPKAYSNSNDLKNHERSNHGTGTNQKPYACNMCDMRFYHPCRLSKHLKTHERPFQCMNCPKSFTTNIFLEKHFISKHSIAFEEIVVTS